jgi:hypothetical protein
MSIETENNVVAHNIVNEGNYEVEGEVYLEE